MSGDPAPGAPMAGDPGPDPAARQQAGPDRAPVAVVGAGLIGRAWAIVFARAGHTVRLTDVDAEALERAGVEIDAQLRMLHAHDLLDEAPATVQARIRPEPDLAAAVHGVALVQENVRETLQAKQQMFSQLDALAPPQAVLASSTSWLPASLYTEALPHRDRCLVAHPVNPPHLVPLVELCPAPWTSTRTMDQAHALYAGAGQSPIRLAREIEGFVLNRLQGALLNEALKLYEEGIASAEDIDTTVRDGLGLRWSFIGPFETIDLNAPEGVLDYARRYGGTYGRIAAEGRVFDWDSPALQRLDAERRERLPVTGIGRRSRWRDARLTALAALKRALARADRPD